jgi:transcriptional regulator with XRE-family HTH domain
MTHSGLDGADLDRAAAAAFGAYSDSRARTFSLRSFRDRSSPSIVERLTNSGTLIPEAEDAAHFSHHLQHDYLVARYVAALPPEEWTHRTLEIMTLEQSSFDPVAMALEHLAGDRADAFLRSLYDWNLYATGYALGESANGPVAPSREMQTVIYAMLAEKRFDLVLQTRRRATDALLMIPSGLARHFADAPDLEAILGELEKVQTSAGWFRQWRDLFIRRANQTLAPPELEALGSDDSVIGWTAANVARRMKLTQDQLAQLRSKLAGAPGTVRWRIAHVLGAFPSQENFATLVQLIDDPSDQLVQYGALRSLAEMAARADSAELREAIVTALLARIDMIERNRRFKDELARVLVIDPSFSPPDWKHVVARFAREFFVRTEDPLQQDKWRAYVADVEARYRGRKPAVPRGP